jgi:hypothetical protein
MHKSMLLMLVLATLVTLADWSAAGEETIVDGAARVTNTDVPRDGVMDMELTEVWRRGGEEDDVLFGVVLKALSDEAGNIYLLDQQLSEVQVFGPDGEYLKTLSGEGDGPGEVRQPSDMLWMPDGTLGIVQTFPGRIVKIDLEGNPAGIFKTGEEGAIIAVAEARSAGGNLVMGVIDIEVAQAGQDRHIFLGSYDENGIEQCRYTGFDTHWDFSDLVFREREQYFVMFGKWDLLADGRVIAVPDLYDYAFNIYAANGTLERSVSRAFEAWERDDQDRAFINAIMEGASRQFPFPITTEIEDHETPIGQVLAHPNGEVWILPARGVRNQPAGVLSTWDVFDREGHFVRQVRVRCPGDGRKDGIFFIGVDRLLVVHGLVDALAAQFGGSATEAEEDAEEAQPIEVVCYRIET